MERVYFATIVGAMERRDMEEPSLSPQIPRYLLERLGCNKFRERSEQPGFQDGSTIALEPLYRNQEGNLIAVVTRPARKLRAKLSESA